MNKDVIYIEPEDDITDIITKIEKAKSKIVALVPPKKAGVFRSIVNIKLIAKAGFTADKNIVIVTTDPSITKLAAATKLPVAESLQSAPSVPILEDDEPAEEKKETKEADEKENDEKEPEEDEKEADDDDTEEDDEEEEEEEEEKKPAKKESKAKKTTGAGGNKVITWIKDHRTLSICSVIFVLLVTIMLIWAFAIAPAADINVAIKTEQKRFSQNVTFTKKIGEEDGKTGKFYIEEKKLDDVKEVTFKATGKKNVGEKAKGEVIVGAYFEEEGVKQIDAGAVFTISGLSYVSDEAATIRWDGQSKCDNADDQLSLINSGCLISTRVKVTATQSGEKYNIAPSRKGWSVVGRFEAYSDDSMTGGTDKMITVVQQSDIDKAKDELLSNSEDGNRAKLFASIDEDKLAIQTSFKQEVTKVESTPEIDKEVEEGETPTLKVTTTATVYLLDRAKLEEFIDETVKLNDDQKIYDIQNVRVENFAEGEKNTTAKLKANYFIGPKITEGELVERVLGKGISDATREIRDIYGISSVEIQTSFPWVMTIPSDSNKVNISLEVKDENGNNVKDKEQVEETNTEDEE